MKTKLNGFLTLILAFMVQITFAQQKTVTGMVSDASGPLPGVTVVVKGTDTGTQSDFDGNYTIKASSGDVLQFSYIGMNPIEKVVGNSNTVNVTMTESAEALEEVVVTALGITRKPKEMSYSVQSVKSDQLTKTKSVNVATSMVGKVSGLQVNTINNGVNPSTRVVLRGNRSLLGNNQALIVVDGFPSARGVLDRISPSDIQTVTVLKGANASALYGSDAANGVLIITTKKGNGKLNVTFDTSTTMENLAYLPKLQDEFGAGGFPDGTLYPLENVAWGPRYDGQLVDASETYDDGRVWQVPFTPIKDVHKNFFDTGLTFRNGITIGAGDETSDFLFSIDHSNVSGVVPKDKYNRTNVRLKASKEMGKFKVAGNFSFFRSHANTVGEGGRQGRPVYWNVLNTPLHIPLDQMKNWKDGEFTRNEVSYYRFYENPYFIIDTQREKSDYTEFTFISDFSYDFTDWLSASLKVGYTGGSSSSKREFGALTYDFHLADVYSEMDPYGASTADAVGTSTRVNSDFLLTFDKNVTEDINVKAIAGHNLKMTSSKRVNVSGDNLIVPDFYHVSTRTGELGGGEASLEQRKIGVYGDLTVGYKDWIYLNFTARNDWTSTLSSENNSYFYPGGGVSFVASNAFPNIVTDKGFSYLKASFNITKTGNDPAAYVANNIFFAPGNFPYGSTAGLSQSTQVADPGLSPEFTTSTEVGVEFALFHSRLNANITAYKTNSTDQLVGVNVSHASGSTRNFTNIGEIENSGLEIDLNGVVVKTDDFSFDLGINYSGYQSEVISLQEGVDELDIGGFSAAQVVAKVGESYPLLRTTSYLKDDSGRIIVDADGDPIQDTKNQIQGKTTPDYALGFNGTLKYKNWSLYAAMDYRTGHVFYNSLVDLLEFTGLSEHSATAGRQPFVFPNSSYDDGNGGYTPNNDRLTSGGGNAFWDSYNEVKENYVTDATTLKLREVALAYTFDQDWISSVGLTDITMSLFGRNLVTWLPAENSFTDPEFNFTSGNAVGVGTQSQTPPTRQFGVSLSIKF